jgi:hypothetical protein
VCTVERRTPAVNREDHPSLTVLVPGLFQTETTRAHSIPCTRSPRRRSNDA